MPNNGQSALPHKISMHIEVQEAICFMQDNVCPYHLVSVARAIAEIAPVLWGHHHQEEIMPLRVGVDVGALMREDSMPQSLQADATQSVCHADREPDGGDGPGPEGVPVP
jgi:hypothetical protein